MSDKAYKAKQLRYKRAALGLNQRDRIVDELYEISEECNDLEWSITDDEKLIDVFDGDLDEISEFRMMFSDLSYKCERLQSAIVDGYVTEHFDDFFVGSLGSAYTMVGYDSVEEDYFSLTRFEARLATGASGKRLMALTKSDLIAISGQCIGLMMSFLDIRHSYDCLKSVFDALKDDRAELLKSVRTIEDLYEKTQKDQGDRDAQNAYDRALGYLPDRLWIE